MPIEDVLYPFLGAYQASPQWFKSSVGRLYSWVPKGVRYGAQYHRFSSELARRDAGHIQLLTRRKLEGSLRWAINTVPAYQQYRKLLGKDMSPEDMLRELPLLSKEEIKADLESFASRQCQPAHRLVTFTGGSTSTPMKFYLEKNVTRPREYAFMDDFHARVGLDPQDIILALRGRSVPTAVRAQGPFWAYEPIKRHLMFSPDHMDEARMPGYIEAMRRWKPTIIQAYPSLIQPLANWLREHPAPDVTSRIRGILLYSESALDVQLDFLREVFGCPVLRHYGHSERVLMAASMPDDDRYFFWPQYGKFELVDKVGKPITEPGVLGEVVGTSYDNHAMAFLRYRTGDFAVLSDKPHPDLPLYPACERLEGRMQEFMVCKDKRLVSVTSMGAAHSAYFSMVDAAQFEQFRPGHLVLNLLTSRPLPDGAVDGLLQAMDKKLKGMCDVEVRVVDHLDRTPRGKLQMLVQHLDIRAYM
ncbi:AMP-binding protein [Thermithiobacillus plumbiphilus]|uniref:AMP-binding protein n=1 Tax=Thermithiobacillus plumbiphilus TaxID=1729899 RepID=A0ABU9DB87_9PROT